ncbi:MAG: hypothetical protein ACNA8H_11135 [Anaerolineales bacterium]
MKKSDSDKGLLRRFEPIIRYTRGEQFFPLNVESYVNASSLWMQPPGKRPICLIPEGELSLDKLSEPLTNGFGTVYFLKFIEPLNIPELATYAWQEGLKRKDSNNIFHAGSGRLARVGYTSRIIDAIFTLTLLARGRVPGDTAVAAYRQYRRIMGREPSYCYYGRVIKQNGWIALQYWFFYPFNNWRTGFFGANDHEADWEMVYVYLSQKNDGDLQPDWVAYASHDFSGDDLRRRWDDPELEKVGDHPVVYCGAGSHASYFSPGEYLTEIEVPFLQPLVRINERIQLFWRNLLRHNDAITNSTPIKPAFSFFRIPFVDYARGDGISIGPGCDIEWDAPQLLTPPPKWAIQYRGLWGLYVKDPLAGENAPAGPVYNRDGTVRRSWYDPLGWSGLDKVPPSNETIQVVQARREELEASRARLAKDINLKHGELNRLGVELAAMQGQAHLAKANRSLHEELDKLSDQVKNLRAEYATEGTMLEALDQYEQKLLSGERESARAHIRRAHHPATEVGLRISRIAENWAAISVGLVMLTFVGIIFFARQYLFIGMIAMVSLLVIIEAGFKRQLFRLVRNLTILLAISASIILVIEFFWAILVLLIIASGSYIIFENIKELRS